MFRNFWLRFRNKKREDIVEKTVRLLNNVKQSKINLLYSSDYSIVEINVLEKRIVSYTNTLKKINDMLDNGQVIYASSVPIHQSLIYARDFFTDSKGYYTDIPAELERFIEETEKFMRHHINLTLLINRSFEQDKCITSTQHIFNELVILSESL